VGSTVAATPSADAFDTESESESLSGDDVDAAAAAVEVDPVMLKNVERVVEKVSAAKVGMASKPHDDITNGDAGEYSDRESSGKAEKEKAAEGELGRSGRFGAVSKTQYKQPIAKRSRQRRRPMIEIMPLLLPIAPLAAALHVRSQRQQSQSLRGRHHPTAPVM
jgi:hypothetical protein